MRLVAGAGLALVVAAPAAADTLREALASAYAANPTLTGQRAAQRATDEGVPIARAAGLPSLDATGSYNEYAVRATGSDGSPLRAATAGVTFGVPFYLGGSVKNGVRAADARVGQGRALLRSAENSVFTQVVGAYMDVIRDDAIVDLNRGNVRVLETNVQASRDRFQVGDLTRTDVAQSEARLAIARSQLQSALAQLDQSRETYLRLVGSAPNALEAPPPLPPFPASPDDAVDIAVDGNPDLVAARAAAKAAGYDVRVASSARLPRIQGFASGDYVNYLGTLGSGIALVPGTGTGGTGTGTGGTGTATGVAYSQHQATATVGVQATLPLFQGGLPGAQVRRAQALEGQALERITETERGVVANTRANYSLYIAAQGVIRSSEQAVQANELALEGVRAEQGVGTRNVLDVLNAEQELLNSRVQLVTARRDAYVAGFALLAAMGRAEAGTLGLDGGPLYDPNLNYRRVRHSINDFAQDPTPQPVAPRTVGVALPSQVVAQPGDLPQNQPGRTAAPVATQTTPATPVTPPAPAPVTSPQN